jgi:arylsulfatase A-like enzyme
VLTNLKKLAPDVVTLAEVLKANGYANGGFTGDAGVSGHFGFAQGFDEYFDGPKFGGMDKSIPAALAWLNKNQDKKFFMFLHGYDCHGQYDPPKGFSKRFVDFEYTGTFKGGKEEQGKLREEGLEKGAIQLNEADVKFWRSLYDEKINDVDTRFQVFIDELKKMGLLEKTIIVLVSDHGTEFFEHQRFDHGFSLYDELLHVPLVFWLPNTKGGVVVEDQVRSIDIMPTVLDLLGIKPSRQVNNQIKGVSLLPALKGEPLALDAYSETDYRYFTHKRSVRTSDGWKFIYTMENGQKELYNLNEDPYEKHNLVEIDKRHAYELEQKLFAWLKTMGQDEFYYDRLMKDVLRIIEY